MRCDKNVQGMDGKHLAIYEQPTEIDAYAAAVCVDSDCSVDGYCAGKNDKSLYAVCFDHAVSCPDVAIHAFTRKSASVNDSSFITQMLYGT